MARLDCCMMTECWYTLGWIWYFSMKWWKHRKLQRKNEKCHAFTYIRTMYIVRTSSIAIETHYSNFQQLVISFSFEISGFFSFDNKWKCCHNSVVVDGSVILSSHSGGELFYVYFRYDLNLNSNKNWSSSIVSVGCYNNNHYYNICFHILCVQLLR